MVRHQAGITQRLCRVLGLDPGLAGLQSRRLAALLVRDCAHARLLNYWAECRHHCRWMSRRLGHPRPQRARDRDPARWKTQERPRHCSPFRHCPRADQSRRHSSTTPVPTPTPSPSLGRAPLSPLFFDRSHPHPHPHLLPPHPLPCQMN